MWPWSPHSLRLQKKGKHFTWLFYTFELCTFFDNIWLLDFDQSWHSFSHRSVQRYEHTPLWSVAAANLSDRESWIYVSDTPPPAPPPPPPRQWPRTSPLLPPTEPQVLQNNRTSVCLSLYFTAAEASRYEWNTLILFLGELTAGGAFTDWCAGLAWLGVHQGVDVDLDAVRGPALQFIQNKPALQ